MHQKDAKAFLPLVQALAEGKTIQYNMKPEHPRSTWGELYDVCFINRPECYRIKPEPTWRPWKPSEVPKYFMISLKDTAYYEGGQMPPFVAVADPGTGIIKVKAYKVSESFHLDVVFRLFMRLDEHGNATPCGVLETP